jgi:hypothetical protein
MRVCMFAKVRMGVRVGVSCVCACVYVYVCLHPSVQVCVSLYAYHFMHQHAAMMLLHASFVLCFKKAKLTRSTCAEGSPS